MRVKSIESPDNKVTKTNTKSIQKQKAQNEVKKRRYPISYFHQNVQIEIMIFPMNILLLWLELSDV
jgi:hypothetical protein